MNNKILNHLQLRYSADEMIIAVAIFNISHVQGSHPHCKPKNETLTLTFNEREFKLYEYDYTSPTSQGKWKFENGMICEFPMSDGKILKCDAFCIGDESASITRCHAYYSMPTDISTYTKLLKTHRGVSYEYNHLMEALKTLE